MERYGASMSAWKAHAEKLHEKHFGWKTFRVLTVTTDHRRMQSMMEALRRMHVPNNMRIPLFYFAMRDELRASDPLTHEWRDGTSHGTCLTVGKLNLD